jgi:Uma2 family endonuclease
MPAISPPIKTLADLLAHLGEIALDRIRFHPAPGTATTKDVIEVKEREGVLCELVNGVLVEKAMGFRESILGMFVGVLLDAFVRPRNLGLVTGEAGTMELMPDLVRIPDVAFTRWDRLPGRRCPDDPIPAIAPNLAVEVLSGSNTRGEMRAKRLDYFTAGVELVWEIDPVSRQVTVYTSVSDAVTLTNVDLLDGGTVLPGFSLPLGELFGELDRHG